MYVRPQVVKSCNFKELPIFKSGVGSSRVGQCAAPLRFLKICFGRILKLTDPEIDRSKMTTDMEKVENLNRFFCSVFTLEDKSNIPGGNSRQITKTTGNKIT